MPPRFDRHLFTIGKQEGEKEPYGMLLGRNKFKKYFRISIKMIFFVPYFMEGINRIIN